MHWFVFSSPSLEEQRSTERVITHDIKSAMYEFAEAGIRKMNKSMNSQKSKFAKVDNYKNKYKRRNLQT